jgi:DNA repair protein SbcC/Rad50
MKPIKLSMTAFGPYKEIEVIDFRDLKEHRLFLISGNTGAGKTTIFDAICFALYGEASGEDRKDPSLLRSHYANDDDHTAVELVFELRGNTYRVLRQLPHIKEGNKTPTGGRQELYQLGEREEETPIVDRMIITEVNTKLEALLGLSKDQFSQIVMLPQGEFRKLLTSETENKEAILRRIFRTEPYQWMSERLRDKRQEVKGEFEHEKASLDRLYAFLTSDLPERNESTLAALLSREHFNTQQVGDALKEEQLYYEEQTAVRETAFNQAEIHYNKQLERLHLAEATNSQFIKLDQKKEERETLENQRTRMEEQALKLEKAEKAGQIKIFDQHFQEAQKDLFQKREILENTKLDLEAGKRKLAEAQTNYDVAQNEGPLRDKLQREKGQLENLAPKIEQLETRRIDLANKAELRKGLQESLDHLEKWVTQETQNLENLRRFIQEKEVEALRLPNEEKELAKLREQAKLIQNTLKLEQTLYDLQKEATVKQAESQSQEEKVNQLEKAWLDGQASFLAQHLHDGKPCPVCGSESHPYPAVPEAALPSREAVDQERKILQEKERQYHTVLGQLQSTEAQVKTLQGELTEAGLEPADLSGQLKALIQKGKLQKERVEEIMATQEKLLEARDTFESKTAQLKIRKEELERTEEAFHQSHTDFEKIKALYEEMNESIPEQLRRFEDYKKHTVKVTEDLTHLEKRWEWAQKLLQKQTTEVGVAFARLQSAEENLKESEQKKARAAQTFEEQWRKAGFNSEEAYQSTILPEEARLTVKQEIETFYEQFSRVGQQLADLEQELKDKTREDLEALKDLCQSLKEERDHAQALKDQNKLALEKTIYFMGELTEAEARLSDKEKQLQLTEDLYQVIRGSNPKRVSLERYLQIEFLEQIVQLANLRLNKLSNGQFYLIRSERVEKNSRPSGLGLDVYDAYTGQTRDVKSLSGGEKFNASLCLALGMSDVIQSYQGGVSIDTMFIDEGFGSLDEEALNKAMDALIDLQKTGRMIGVISHVNELKQAIPAILEVKKSREGQSHAGFVIL